MSCTMSIGKGVRGRTPVPLIGGMGDIFIHFLYILKSYGRDQNTYKVLMTATPPCSLGSGIGGMDLIQPI